MMLEQTPRYEAAFSKPKARSVAETLAKLGGATNFSEIEKMCDVKGSVLLYNLDRLISYNIVEKEGRGTYRLKFKTPLSYLFPSRRETEVAYLGLLGRREGRHEPETEVALELLKKEGLKPKLIYVTTSPEAVNDWKHIKLPYQWILCYEEEIVDIEAVRNKVHPQLQSLMKENIVILDCTSATKPATISYYELAQMYMAPLVYIYEESKKLRWLLSREWLKKRLHLAN